MHGWVLPAMRPTTLPERIKKYKCWWYKVYLGSMLAHKDHSEEWGQLKAITEHASDIGSGYLCLRHALLIAFS